MKLWMRKLGLGVIALSLAVAVAGCDDGGGANLIRIFFGIVGDGDCSKVEVVIDLDAAGAEVRTNNAGIPDCRLDGDLDDAGCVADFDVDGGLLTANIAGCTVPEIAALFSCVFEPGVNLGDLSDATTATCVCAGDICDEEPPVCVDGDQDPLSCEDCTNGIDDDGNGLTDCDDPACEHQAPCDGGNTTTTSTTTTISDTTTTLPPTTTTLLPTTTTALPPTTTSITLPPPFECNVVFKLDSDQLFGSLQVDVDYSNLAGRPVGSGGDVDCESLALTKSGDQVTLAANNKVALQIITLGFLLPDPNKAGFEGPQDLAECRFLSAAPCLDDDFVLDVTDASDDSEPGNAINPNEVDASIGNITVTNLGGTTTLPPTTTTLPPTTTTLPAEITTTTVPTGDTTTTTQGSGDTTTTTSTTTSTTEVPPSTTTTTSLSNITTTTEPPACGSTQVLFSLDDTQRFGSLQFNVDFSGTDPGVTLCDCFSVHPDATFVPNPNNNTRSIVVGGIAKDPFGRGFKGGQDVAGCLIQDGSPAATAGQFSITVAEASSIDNDPYVAGDIDMSTSIAP
jgi:hypothetical protein